ncbi:MAG: helix-turn-helix domain-containing protein [Myxococcales bacterium]|nr:helix-turn-helix domain-containing protein [Myxococcales bacterium]
MRPRTARARAGEPASPRPKRCFGEGSARCDPRGQGQGRVRAHTCTWPASRTDDPPGPQAEGETLSFAEALALIGISRNTLYRLAAEGRIPGAQKLGKAWRFHRGTLLHFLAHPELYRRRR